MKQWIIILICFLMADVACAEVIKLKSGESVNGAIIERSDESVKVDIGNGTKVTYFLDEIESMDDSQSTKAVKPAVVSDKQSTVRVEQAIASAQEIAPEKDAYVSQQFGLSLKAPDGWRILENVGPYTIVTWAENDSEQTASVSLEYLPAAPGALEGCLKDLEQQFIRGANNLEILEKPQIIAGKNNNFVKTIFKKKQYKDFAFFYYIFSRGKMFYQLSCSGQVDKVDFYKNIFDKTAESLKFTGEEPPLAQIYNIKEAFTLAHDFFQEGNFDQAIAFYEAALVHATNDDEKAQIFYSLSAAYLDRGVTAYIENKDDSFFKKSIDYANQCLAINPAIWQAWGNLAVVQGNMGNLEKADSYYTEMEKAALQDPEAKKSPAFLDSLVKHGIIQGLLKKPESVNQPQGK